MSINNRIDEIFNELVAIRRDLHQNPELSNYEFNTQKKIMAYLSKNGIENYECAKTGVVGILGKAPYTAFRADIDALPIQEVTDLSFKSRNEGVMHACGHDLHTTILLGTAKILSELNLDKGIKFFFQPAEETTGGALPMIEENVLDGVEYVYGLHVMPYLKTGMIEIKKGQLNASSTGLKIDIYGKSGHGAYPESGVDAIVVAANIVSAIQTLVSRNISPLNSAVISLGSIHGGNKGNIICDHVSIVGTMRTLNPETTHFMKTRIRDLVTDISSAYNSKGDIQFNDGYEALINHEEVTSHLEKVAIKTIGQTNIVHKLYPSMGVEDFSYFSNRVPGSFYHLGCQIEGTQFSLHQNNFEANENCIKTGIQMNVGLILDPMA